MNWKAIATLALKITVAAAAGAAVFVGIERAVNGNKKNPAQNFGENNTPMPGNSGNECNQCGSETGDVLINSLKATMNTSSKIFDFAQTLTGVVECAGRIFGKNSNTYSQPYNQYGPVNMNGQTWTRVSPFIIEAGSGPYNRYGTNNNYPF